MSPFLALSGTIYVSWVWRFLCECWVNSNNKWKKTQPTCLQDSHTAKCTERAVEYRACYHCLCRLWLIWNSGGPFRARVLVLVKAECPKPHPLLFRKRPLSLLLLIHQGRSPWKSKSRDGLNGTKDGGNRAVLRNGGHYRSMVTSKYRHRSQQCLVNFILLTCFLHLSMKPNVSNKDGSNRLG